MRRYSQRKHTHFIYSFPFSTLSKPPHLTALPDPCLAATTDTDAYAHLLRQCAASKCLAHTELTHLRMVKTGFPHLTLGNKLLDAYLKCGAVDDARQLLDEMPNPHIVSWNNLVSSYIRHGRSREAVGLYREMLLHGVRPDEYTFSSIFRAFADAGLQLDGEVAHGHLVIFGLEPTNAFVASSLVDMYSKIGNLNDARLVFDRILEKDVVLVTALIVGYTQNGENEEAIRAFRRMSDDGVTANEFTIASILTACGNLRVLDKGVQVHGAIVKSGLESRNAPATSLLIMYSKCSLVEESLKIFRQIRNPNIVAWTAVIGAFASNNLEEQALTIFREMARCSMEPNEFTLSSALAACSGLALIVPGKQIHAQTLKIGFHRHGFVGAALIEMYAKCGNIIMAELFFHSMVDFDIVSMNSMLHGYAQNGYGHEALKLFDLMHIYRLKPNEATFTGILSACSNHCLLEEARRIFSLIPNYCKAGPSKEHYACLVDVLGRSGRLEEAECLILTVKDPDVILWRAFMSACRIHGNVQKAEKAARRILELDPGDDATLVLLSNIYASSGQWHDVIRMKTIMREMKLKKEPAMSWVQVNREVHIFLAGDTSHPKAEEICKELGRIVEKVKSLGYVPDTRFVLQELDETDKVKSLYLHSEKLAITFALLSSNPLDCNTCIVIYKNLRVCGDCHSWIKLVTKLVGREITARDAKRFHHFKDGLCSCRDFW